jgi:hypothetical protein
MKVRRVAKDKRFKSVPKKYLSGVKGSKRSQRGRDLARMQRLYKAGGITSSGKAKSFGSWSKVRQILSKYNMDAYQKDKRERKKMANLPYISTGEAYFLESVKSNI